jgi:hypothetical protein
MMVGYAIPEIYLPDVDSFYVEDLTQYYETLFSSISDDQGYEEFVKRRGLNLIIKPNGTIHKDALTSEDAGLFLVNFTSSYKAYAAHEFFNKYKSQYSNSERLSKGYNRKKLTN